MSWTTLTRGRLAVPIVTFALVAALLSGTGLSGMGARAASSRSHANVKYGGTVVLDNVGGALWTCGLNPYNGANNFITLGFTYETLVYDDALNGKIQPWLASGYSWSNGNKTLTFTIRKGVTWNDGKPFTAADVVYTFRLLRRNPALDGNGDWQVLKSVSRHGNNVVMNFKKVAVPDFYYVAGQTYIVPQHIWSKIKNPVTYIDSKPVSTGPMVVSKCDQQDIIMMRNPHYWQKGKPYIKELRAPAFLDNGPGNQYLAQGKANWGCQYIPNVNTYYVQGNSNRHWYYAPGSDVDLYPNNSVFPTNIKAVREAISLAIDRRRVSQLGVYGYLPPADQSGIVLPTYSSWYDRSLAKHYNYSYNPSKAIKLLESAGFKRGAGGIFQKNGKKLSLTILGVAGFSDWVAELQQIQNELKAVGINATVSNLSGDTQLSDIQSGHYQLAYYFTGGGPSPYYEMHYVLDSGLTAPIGSTATGDYERWRNSATDSLLNRYAQTTSSATQHAIINELQGIMLKNVPVIPVLEGVSWYQYDTTQLVGWPTRSNEYVNPGCNTPDQEIILLHLHLK
ncbi:MAG TPA: ABC transporter substrate-binding protein [Chloroflexota bacterium]|nr:ABC transporter substrate-binding protein [Chloroflexota bacterium]